jgi:hypothetical protein
MKLKPTAAVLSLLAAVSFSTPLLVPSAGLIAPAEAAAAKLGDLSGFRKIVVDTTTLVEKSDLSGARRASRIWRRPGTRRSPR